MNTSLQIRTALPDADARALVDIYAPYIRETAVTFEYAVPSPEDFAARIRHILEKHPYLVALRDGDIIGYAYAGVFIGRSACDWSVEASLYVRRDCHGLGAGRALYGALEAVLALQGIVNVNACIACPSKEEDEYISWNSVNFHRHMGYRLVGEFHNAGYKFGRWHNLVWMEKHIAPHQDCQPPVRWFPEVRDQAASELGIF
ncbi:MAG: GNAT family N-acetyltransferase [Oscillibacter sp.]|nr:GNAT family N-acetyltransferase [Oscillibacter sp.]